MTGTGKTQKLEGLEREEEKCHCLWVVRPRGAGRRVGRTEDTFVRFLGGTPALRPIPGAALTNEAQALVEEVASRV